MDKKDEKTTANSQEEEDKMPALAPIKKTGLTSEKKAGLKQIMGKYSGKASLSTIRENTKK